jgi:hypothetical protein
MNTRTPFSGLAASAAVAAALAVGIARPAHANHLDFTLYNESGRSITYLYVSAAGSKVWGQDILGQGVLRNGGSTRITFPGQNSSSPCWWDLKVVYSDRTSAVNRFDLCTESRIYAR